MFKPGQLVRCVRGHETENELKVVPPRVRLVRGRLYTVRESRHIIVDDGRSYTGISVADLPPVSTRCRQADGSVVMHTAAYNAVRFEAVDDTKLDALREHLSATLWNHRTVG